MNQSFHDVATSYSTFLKIFTFTSEFVCCISIVDCDNLNTILIIERQTHNKCFSKMSLFHIDYVVINCFDDLLTNSFKYLFTSIKSDETEEWCLKYGFKFLFFSIDMSPSLLVVHLNELYHFLKDNCVSFASGDECLQSVVE